MVIAKLREQFSSRCNLSPRKLTAYVMTAKRENVLCACLTQNVNVSIAKCISMNIACITLDHLQVTATISAVLTCIRQNQLRPVVFQVHLVWHVVCCNMHTFS